MYQKDDPGGPWSVWLSISFALPPLALPFSSVWLWQSWQSGLGQTSVVIICEGGQTGHTVSSICKVSHMQRGSAISPWAVRGILFSSSFNEQRKDKSNFSQTVCFPRPSLSLHDFISDWLLLSCSFCPLFDWAFTCMRHHAEATFAVCYCY